MEARLDMLLVQMKIVSSREKAKELIKSGQVYINGMPCIKASLLFDESVKIDIKGETLKYVGRGGLKLEKAIQTFHIDLRDKICADIGASTGGFTDCMLQNNAKKVYAVDVGHGQLAEKLQEDKRVENLEGVNVRYITDEHIPEKLNFIGIDVSFISLMLVIPKLLEFLSENGEIIALIKPQFEAGKSEVGKKGVVKSQKAHVNVIKSLLSFFENNKLSCEGLTFSPIKGPEGNIEYLAYLKKSDKDTFFKSIEVDIKNFVETTFESLK